jgi:predicted cupin superfamily sugar epimerase
MNVDALSPDELIDLLGLQPHPEGGWYAETFRDSHEIDEGDSPRPASTAIYFLLTEGQVSHWHRVDAVEVWHWHAGAPLELSIAATEADAPIVLTLGNDLASGFRPQGIVPRHHWQSAKSLGAWTLVGCTVAPGFWFEGFELAEPGWMPG